MAAGDDFDDSRRGDAPRSDDPGRLKAKSRASIAPTIRPDEGLHSNMLAGLVAQAQQRKGSLLVIAGAPADIGTHVVVDGTVVVGRDTEGLQLRDGLTSRRHISIEPGDGTHVLHDLGSTNGTLVNGVRISGDHELRDADQICIGQTILKFTLVDPTEAAYLRNMERLAGTDELTGLLAKHRFDSLLAEAVRSANATAVPISLLMMDMDGLKTINDRHGHPVGAHTISQVGRLIGEAVRGHGEACRFGGDEYCALLVGLDLTGAMGVGEQIRAAVERTPYVLGQTTVRATISIGAAALSPEESTPEALLAAADQALYRAKGKGRNTVSS